MTSSIKKSSNLQKQNWFLRLHQKHPDLMRRVELQVLMYLTASAFSAKPQWILQKNPDEALQCYAAYTRAQLLQILDADIPAIRRIMYIKAHRMGRILRSISMLHDEAELTNLVKLLYCTIGITVEGTIPGTIFVTQCYFSSYYTPQMCVVMSAMDDGIISGIFGSGSLQFTKRITEGCATCKAYFFQ